MTIIRMADVRAALDDAGYSEQDHESGEGLALGLALLGYDANDIMDALEDLDEGSAEGGDDE